MQILWIADAPDGFPDADPASLCASRMASQRMRIGLPVRALQSRPALPASAEVTHGLCNVATALAQVSAGEIPEVVVFSKILQRHAAHVGAHVELARRLAAQGSRIVMDICDNPFGQPLSGGMLQLLKLASVVVANSPAMAEIIAAQAGREAVVIADPVEGVRRPPKFEPQARPGGWLRKASGRLKLLWFGVNYAYLRPWLPRLEAHARGGMGIDLMLVSAPLTEIDADIQRWSHAAGAGLSMDFTPWSPQVMPDAFALCDLVFLPSDPADSYRIAASANRLTESLQAGRLVVASGVPSYWEFRDSAWIGDRLEEGLDWAMAHPREVLARISTGQQRVDARYLPSVVAGAWAEALGMRAASA
jgi:hypothetical protein